MASNPAFIATPVIGVASVPTANTNIDGTGAITSLIAGAASGTRVLEIDVQCAATSAAALVNVFLSTDTGSTWVLFDQIAVTAATSSTTVKANRNIATYANLVLPSAAYVLGVTNTITQACKVVAFGGSL